MNLPITPALTHFLMTGTYAEARLKGWVRLTQGDPSPDVAWAAHRDRLIADAAAHGFQPYWLTKRRPTGAGFAAWDAEFLKTFRY